MPNTKRRILVIDDDEGIATLQVASLSRFGHEVMAAYSSHQALELLEKLDRVDLILVDYSLTNDITGLSLLLIMKERGVTAPAILVTGLEDPTVILEALRAGVRDFIPKTLDYLDHLPIAVERVLRQAAIEQQAAASVVVLEKQELLEAAFDAARLCAFIWDFSNNTFKLTGRFEDLLGPTRVSHLADFESFLSFLNPSDQVSFKKAFENARDTKTSLEHQFRIHRDDGKMRWIWAVVRFNYDSNGLPARATCVLNDISSRKSAELEVLQSNEKTRVLNERLQLGMVETNHRVKNHLQKLVSLLNIQLRNGNGTLDSDAVKTVVSHIQALAALHDVLTDEASCETADGLTVDVSDIFTKILSTLGRVLEDRTTSIKLDHCRVTSKQAASLAVIFNELLTNSLKHSAGHVTVELQESGETGVLSVENDGSQFPPQFDPENTGRTGLQLVGMLCRSDFGTAPKFHNTIEGNARIDITFPISVPISQDSAGGN